MTTTSPLADRLGGGSGMFAKATEAPAPAVAAPVVEGPTPKQTAFIRNLLAEREGVEAAEAVRKVLNDAREAGALTKRLATKAITDLLAIDAAPKAREARVAKPKVNKFGGKCNACGRNVAAEAGLVQMGDEGKWVVWHEICPSDFPFPEGRYAVPGGEETDGELRFYHLVDGEVFVMASDVEHLITNPHTAKAIIDKIALDPEEASRVYGREFERCGICGRGLTNKASRDAGIGPVCLEKSF